MAPYRVAGHNGAAIELDLCHACHGIWFDGNENLRMSPQGVIDLFGDLHQHRDDPHTPLAQTMHCPRCRRTLAEGVDVVKSGRYFTHRCPERHGRFTTFSSFMIEKGFVRQLTRPEIEDLADALVSIERDRARQQREEQKERWQQGSAAPASTDLWAAGLELVWRVLMR